MVCPYCGKEMVEGHVSPTTYELKFFPKHKEEILTDNLCRGVIRPHILLTKGNLFITGSMECFYCTTCKLLLSQVKDFNNK